MLSSVLFLVLFYLPGGILPDDVGFYSDIIPYVEDFSSRDDKLPKCSFSRGQCSLRISKELD
jgi:hypothetical protein